MHLVACPKQKVPGGPEARHLIGWKDGGFEQAAKAPDAEAHLRHPERGLQVAQPPFPGLQLRLQKKDGVPEFLPAQSELGDLGGDEGLGLLGPLRQLHLTCEALSHCPLARQEPSIQKGRAECHVLARRQERLLRRPHAPAHRHPDVPQQRGQGPGALRHPDASPSLMDEKQVPVRARGELAPAVAAERHQG